MRWAVSIAREGGAPTIAERKKQAHAAKLESVLAEPMVRAVLDRFPGAEVIAVRDLHNAPLQTDGDPPTYEDA